MRNLIIFFIPLILFAYPLFADSHKRNILYGWETSNGVQLRKFGEKNVHPLYEGDAENGQPNGLGIMTYPDVRKYLGQWKDGKSWNGKSYHKNGTFILKVVNGKIVVN